MAKFALKFGYNEQVQMKLPDVIDFNTWVTTDYFGDLFSFTYQAYQKLSSNPSQLARPNVIVVFHTKGKLFIPKENYGKFISTVISFKNLQVRNVIIK